MMRIQFTDAPWINARAGCKHNKELKCFFVVGLEQFNTESLYPSEFLIQVLPTHSGRVIQALGRSYPSASGQPVEKGLKLQMFAGKSFPPFEIHQCFLEV
jgi:hypothetical protein